VLSNVLNNCKKRGGKIKKILQTQEKYDEEISEVGTIKKEN
jgi:hypothetical protein